MAMVRSFGRIFPLGLSPNYEPSAEDSIAGIARRRGLPPEEVAYDLLMEQEGRAILLLAVGNYSRASLDDIRDHLIAPRSVVALGDGGAHYGMVCDASYPTFMLGHWVRDRESGRFSIAEAVKALSSVPAEMIGLGDRGLLEVGRKADVNVIDLDAVRVDHPVVRDDLPAGGRRLDQEARGYRLTIVNGRVIQRDGAPTGELPGRLVRLDGASTPRAEEARLERATSWKS
jgi:N-acyl-D-aspartate/D-glutamate deacylase